MKEDNIKVVQDWLKGQKFKLQQKDNLFAGNMKFRKLKANLGIVVEDDDTIVHICLDSLHPHKDDYGKLAVFLNDINIITKTGMCCYDEANVYITHTICHQDTPLNANILDIIVSRLIIHVFTVYPYIARILYTDDKSSAVLNELQDHINTLTKE